MSTADESSQNTTPDTDATASLEVADQGLAAPSEAGSSSGNSHTRTILEIVGAAVAVVLILAAGVGGFVAGAFAAGSEGDRDLGRAVAEGRMDDWPGEQGMQEFGRQMPGHGREHHHEFEDRGGWGGEFDQMPMDEVPGDMMPDFPQPSPAA